MSYHNLWSLVFFNTLKIRFAWLVFNMSWSTLICEIMCIHFCMSIEHDFIWSTTYCVPACICAQHCIMRTRRLVHGDPTSLFQFCFARWCRLGSQGYITHNMCLQFLCIQDSEWSSMCYQIKWAYEPILHTCI